MRGLIITGEIFVLLGLIGFFFPAFFHRGANLTQASIDRNRLSNKIFAVCLIVIGVSLLLFKILKYGA
jgi:hypothetical protein